MPTSRSLGGRVIERAVKSFQNVFLHLYPVRVPRALLHFRSTWRLGSIATVLFVILLVTGVYLMFLYTPSVTMAYGDLQRLRTAVGFGQLLRNVHRWSAHLMVLVVALHLIRVFWDGAYKGPRRVNWLYGVGLFVVTLAWSFTGYLLPWDQLSYWAVTVGSALLGYVPVIGKDLREFALGGTEIGQATLLRFYVLHVAVLTAAFGVLMALHLWRVRKDGLAVGDAAMREADAVNASDAAASGADVPSAAPRVRLLGEMEPLPDQQVVPRSPSDEVFTWPHLLVRHVVVALATALVVVAMGVAWEAPLRELANPNLTPEPAKAPWYFVGVQELLAHFPPVIGGVLIPAVALLGLAVWPWLDRSPARRPAERKVALGFFLTICVTAFVLTVIGAFFRGPGWGWVLPWQEWYFEP
jgi:quinol-cytochrome oxidoreductase complex cytochrome b subunit